MNIREKLSLDRKEVTLDPPDHLDFIDYDSWEATIANISNFLLKQPVHFYYTKTSKYQCLQTSVAGKKYIVIDDNFIYILGRFSAIAAQIWYAKTYLTDDKQKAEDLIKNAYSQYDVLLSRIEALTYVFYDKASTFMLHPLEILASTETSDEYDKSILDESKLLIGEGSDTFNSYLDTIIDMQYIWIVVHEIAHCYFDENQDNEIFDHIKEFLKDQVEFYKEKDSSTYSFTIEALESLVSEQGTSALEEIACDVYAMQYVKRIFSEKLEDEKLALILTRVAFTVMNYNLRIVNVMRVMNNTLAHYNPGKDTKEEYIESIKEDTRRIQKEYVGRQEYVDYSLRHEDSKVFKSAEDVDEDFESCIIEFMSAAGELIHYGMDYTSKNYIDNFFKSAEHSFSSDQVKNVELREECKKLLMWNTNEDRIDKSVRGDEIEWMTREEFEGYIDFLCYIKYSIDGKIARPAISQKSQVQIQSVDQTDKKCMYGNIALYAPDGLSDELILSIKELADKFKFNSDSSRLRLFINSNVEENIQKELQKEIFIEIIDLEQLKAMSYDINIKHKDIDTALENLKEM